MLPMIFSFSSLYFIKLMITTALESVLAVLSKRPHRLQVQIIAATVIQPTLIVQVMVDDATLRNVQLLRLIGRVIVEIIIVIR